MGRSMGSSVCRCCACSRPFQGNLSSLRSNLIAAEIAMLSGSKLQLWLTGLTRSWLFCPLQWGLTSSVYGCALRKGWGKLHAVSSNRFLLFLSSSLHMSVCAHLLEDLFCRYMCVFASIHLWWPWGNWRASLVAASGCYGTWSVLSGAISWQGTVDNLSPWEPSHIISLSEPLWSGQRRMTWGKALCKQTIPSPLKPPHHTSMLFCDNGRPRNPTLCDTESGSAQRLAVPKRTYTQIWWMDATHTSRLQW